MARRRPWTETLSPKDIARFWSTVQVGKDDECWPCTSLPDNNGRPRFYAQRRFFKASHVAYVLVNGQFESETLDHTCETPACVNPRHLDPTGQSENSKRAVRSGRVTSPGSWQSAKTHCKRNHPLSGDNLLRQHIKGDPPGTRRGRACRACRAETMRKARKKYREKA